VNGQIKEAIGRLKHVVTVKEKLAEDFSCISAQFASFYHQAQYLMHFTGSLTADSLLNITKFSVF
jgi:hypothetical protein